MSPEETRRFLDAVLQARQEATPAELPAGFDAMNAAEAYLLQNQHVERVLSLIGGTVTGTKLGGSPQSIAALGLAGPLRGPIFSALSWASPATLRRDRMIVCIVEAEIGVRFGKDIGGTPQPPAMDELIDAIEAVLPALEVADSRLAGWRTAPPAAALADLSLAGGWVYGAPCGRWRELDLRSLPVRLSVNGSVVAEGNGGLPFGGPLEILRTFIADLGRSGKLLKAGEVVSTGSCTTPHLASTGEHVAADFGPLGQASIDIT